MATIPGLQTGKVVKLENDPAGDYRILIQLSSVKLEKEIWARYSNFDAGSKRGAYFMPEIGDEVLVGFINDEWAQPVVLGMLYSRDRPPVRAHRDTNHVKSYTSRSGMHIQFDDDSKKIEIKTAAGNHLILDETGSKIEIRDQHSNHLLMNRSGIHIKSISELTIDASSNINIRSGAKLTIDANEIELKSRGNMRMSGTSIYSTASANSEIKGSIIKIN